MIVECIDSRVRVLEKDPSRVAVRLEPVRQRSVPVRIRSVDDAPVGYTMLQPKATPAQITVTGPAPLIDSVSEAYVEVRIDGSKVSFVKSYQPQLRDAQGKEVKGSGGIPHVGGRGGAHRAAAELQDGLHQGGDHRHSGARLLDQRHRGPARGRHLRGDPQVLESFGYVETAPVDITGAVTEVLKSVSIFTPPGTALDKKQDVFVKVSVEPIPGGGSAAAADLAQPYPRHHGHAPVSSVDVRLDGPVPDLRNLKPTDLVATIDLTGLLTGTYTLPVAVTGVPTGTKVISVDPEKVGVTIR